MPPSPLAMGQTKLETMKESKLGRTFGATPEALSLFRISLGILLTCELILRFRFLHVFYTDEGTMPLRLLLPRIDNLYRAVCLHCHLGELWQQQILLGFQVLVAVLFTLGYRARIMAILSWYLYTSLILRNTWLYFILDRYFYYLLFYSMFLPLDGRWSWSTKDDHNKASGVFVNPATVALKLLVFWIYIDAGVGKYLDPKQGWSLNADPLPALDTYARHTIVAQYVYAMLGPEGLRLLTPTVVWIEILSPPLAFLGSYLGSASLVNFAIVLICSLHFGISLTIRNAVLLSYVACCIWCVFLPIGWEQNSSQESRTQTSSLSTIRSKLSFVVTLMLVGGMVGGNIWFETIGTDCSTGSLRKIWSTLLQNRWNVFIGAEEVSFSVENYFTFAVLDYLSKAPYQLLLNIILNVLFTVANSMSPGRLHQDDYKTDLLLTYGGEQTK
jgi:hypothetical protein